MNPDGGHLVDGRYLAARVVEHDERAGVEEAGHQPGRADLEEALHRVLRLRGVHLDGHPRAGRSVGVVEARLDVDVAVGARVLEQHDPLGEQPIGAGA